MVTDGKAYAAGVQCGDRVERIQSYSRREVPLRVDEVRRIMQASDIQTLRLELSRSEPTTSTVRAATHYHPYHHHYNNAGVDTKPGEILVGDEGACEKFTPDFFDKSGEYAIRGGQCGRVDGYASKDGSFVSLGSTYGFVFQQRKELQSNY